MVNGKFACQRARMHRLKTNDVTDFLYNSALLE